MKKIFVLLLLVSSLTQAQNIRPQGSNGALHPMRGTWWYDYTYTEADSLTVTNVKKVAAMIDELGGGGGGGTLSGRAGWYARFSSSSAAGLGNIQDTTSEGVAETDVYTRSFHLTYQGFNNKWVQYRYNPTTGEIEHTITGAFGSIGWKTTLDSANNNIYFTGVGGTAGARNITYSGVNNMLFNISGDFQVANQIITSGSNGGITILPRDGGAAFIAFATGNLLRWYTPSGTQPWKIHKDAPADSWSMASTGIVTHGNLQKYASDLSGSYDARTLIDKGYADATYATIGSSGGPTTVAFGSTPNSNGGGISGSTLTLQPADATNPGGISTGSQTIPGAKTFAGNTTFSGTGTSILSVSGTSNVFAGSSFGVEASSASVPVLASNSASTAGVLPAAIFQRNGSYTAANDDGVELRFATKNSAANSKDIAGIHAIITNVTASSETGAFQFRLMDAGASASTKFTMHGSGMFESTSLKTAAPSGGTADVWRLGTVVTTSGLVLSTTQYIEVSINGTLYKLAIANLP